jgi:hypothetical protein
MCRETIRKAVVQKFNESKKWNCTTLEELYDKIEDRNEANRIVNSIKICDPAVGSGHFLVSALNEMIAVKNDLKILQDRDGKRLKEYQVEVVNDELIVTDEEGELFEYKPASAHSTSSGTSGSAANRESQRIQETLFHEKQSIIENCLFGVDINSNSVKICRLRLWIELLKNAYYKVPSPSERAEGEALETLPNIDINIKCGNSLVSRFAIDADLKQALKKSKWTIDSYRNAVTSYRQAQSKEQKREMERLIADIKSDFRSEISQNDPKIKKLQKLEYEFSLLVAPNIFKEDEEVYGNKSNKKKAKERQDKLLAEIQKLRAEIEEIKANKIFENAFEWRFEFPEVLNEDGDFVGFDVVIGNPPYGINLLAENEKTYFKNVFDILQFKIDTYELFLLKAIAITRPFGISAYIIPSTFIDNFFGEKLRELLITKFQINKIIELDDKVFEEAVVHAMIFSFIKKSDNDYMIEYAKEKSNLREFIKVPSKFFLETAQKSLSLREFLNKDFYSKLKKNTIPLKEIIDLRQAIKTGNDKIYISDIAKAANFKKVIGGKNIGKWIIKWDGKYVDYGNHLACPRDYKIFEQPKILIREAGNQITATLDNDNYYILSSLYNGILINEDFEIEFIISQLNSKLFQYLLNQLTFEKTKGAFTKARIFHYYELPIKRIDKKLQGAFVEIVNKIISTKKQNPSADTTDLENRIDQLVYQLYELTEEEIKIVENA